MRYTVGMSAKHMLFKQVAIRTGLVIALAYLLLNLGIALNKNYATSSSIRSLKASITELEQRIAHLHNQLVYLQSTSYRELELKRRLGLKRIGETAVLVPSNIDPAQSASNDRRPTPSLTVDQVTPGASATFFEKASTNASSWVSWLRANW